MAREDIKFIDPDSLDAMLDKSDQYTGEKIAWCLLCNEPIKTVADLIPEVRVHDCRMGRAIAALTPRKEVRSDKEPD